MHLICRATVCVLMSGACSPSAGTPRAMVRGPTKLDSVTIRKVATLAALRSELRYLTRLQEEYFSTHHTYSSSLSQLPGYKPDAGVTSTIPAATATGWSASARHSSLAGAICSIYVGSAMPPLPAEPPVKPSPGEPYCSATTTHDLVR
jgi:hypothetical protein